MSILERLLSPLTHTTFAYYVTCFIFKHRMWRLCRWVEGIPNPVWGGEYRGWVFLGRYHPEDDSCFLMNVPDSLGL